MRFYYNVNLFYTFQYFDVQINVEEASSCFSPFFLSVLLKQIPIYFLHAFDISVLPSCGLRLHLYVLHASEPDETNSYASIVIAYNVLLYASNETNEIHVNRVDTELKDM